MRNLAHSSQRADGFTLTELLVALTVLAILAMLAAPGMGRLLERHRLAATGNELLTLALLARNQALLHNTRVTLCRSLNPNAPLPGCAPAGASWGEGVLVFLDPSGALPAHPAAASALVRVRGPVTPGYGIARVGLTSSSITFVPGGRLKTGTLGVSFEITSPGSERRCLVIATTGRARIAGESCATAAN